MRSDRSGSQSWALVSIVDAQAKAGQWAEAQRTAQLITNAHRQLITDVDPQGRALASIARAQAKAGQWAEAQRTAQLITNPYLEDQALVSIAEAQAKAGQWKAAKMKADSCPTRGQLEAYAAILIEYTKSK